jgi:hypothetical protein
VLLLISPPLARVSVPTFSAMLPAAPAPVVATEIVPPLLSAKVGVDTVICPALPVLSAVLKRPLAEPPGDVPEIETEFAVTPRLPPWPALLVLLETWAPPLRLSVPTFSVASPARPPPEVATEIVPPSPIVKVGAKTIIWPALPVPSAVLNKPLAGLELPEIEISAVALTVTVPP